jgi:cation diffusion facilitator family transporter
MADARSSNLARHITLANVLVSIALAVPLSWVSFRYGSKLGLAQAADSVADSLTAFALLYSLWLVARPADANHPRGHQRAEPLAALFAAVMAGVLAVEVLREAVAALSGAARPDMRWPLAIVFAVKLCARVAMSLIARRVHRKTGSPALRALEVDARNDVLVAALALFGFFAARYGSPGWVAWLAMPIALWIFTAGLLLASENIRLLMGEAPPPERQRELAAIAQGIAGVQSTHDLAARYDGIQLEVVVHIVVDEELSLRKAHDIAEAVEQRLMAEDDVLVAMVHVDVEEDPSLPPIART